MPVGRMGRVGKNVEYDRLYVIYVLFCIKVETLNKNIRISNVPKDSVSDQ